MTNSYPKVMKDSVKIWLNDPITKTYLQCLNFYSEQLKESRAIGGFVDAESNDATIRRLFLNMGAEDATNTLASPYELMSAYNMIEGNVDE